ncbi:MULTISPECIES: hypothetical protein [unclassified Microbacterium]|uniref:hypothetical protein n=1 Tax=unclassified Microbacterium TaxID=2609290 RepID=UPI00343C227A
MSRSAHTYSLDGAEVVLTVPEGVRVPRLLALRSTSEGHELAFEHIGVKAVRSPSKRKPRIEGATSIPSDWTPPADELERLRAVCPSVNFEHELAQLIDWYQGRGQRMKDWTAVWRRWVRETHKRNVEKGWKPGTAATPRDESPKERWLREHGVTAAEYEQKKGDKEWLERIERRGIVA